MLYKKRKWKCKESHTWIAAVSDRKLTGCPTCAKTGFDPNADGFLYFISHPNWEILQIGITNNPDRRLSQQYKTWLGNPLNLCSNGWSSNSTMGNGDASNA
jgi:hypothetical protein